MKKASKILIKKLLDKEIGSLSSSIRSIESSALGSKYDVMTAHADTLKRKIVKLNEAIEELELA